MQNHQTWNIPPLDLQLHEYEVHVWRASLTVPDFARKELQGVLSKEEVERAARFHFEIDRNHWIAARGILRTLLSMYLNATPGQLQLSSNAYGKPFLASPALSHQLQFNISHSQDLALFAFTFKGQVGIDIEYMRAGLDYDALATVSFSPYEQACLHALPYELKREAFFHCWTRKEAYIKARGKAFSIPTDLFDVSFLSGEPPALLQHREEPQEITRWSLHELAPTTGYASALALKGVGCILRCWQWQK